MSKLNTLVYKSSLWLVFSILTIFFFLVSILTSIIFVDIKNPLMSVVIETSAFVSVSLSGLYVAIVSQLRLSKIFWESAEELEKKINDTNIKKELEKLYNTNLIELNSKAFGAVHTYEVKRLQSLIEMKHKLV